MPQRKPPRIKTIVTLADASASIKEWIRAVIESVPRSKREGVMSKLFFTVLDTRSGLLGHDSRLLNARIVGGICFDVAMNIGVRHICLAERALHRRRCPVLVIPQASLSRARKRLRQAGKRVAVEVLGLETAFATAIIFQAGKQCRSTASIWKDVISRYNRFVRKGTLPFIRVKWKNET
jgi:hypothetical protein